jgi:hypothetical protein
MALAYPAATGDMPRKTTGSATACVWALYRIRDQRQAPHLAYDHKGEAIHA